MRVTQFDIAKFARVSQATVSRVLSGDDRVETAIRDRVLETMREHNYRPDMRARSLRLRRTGLIGLVVKRPHGGLADDPFFASLTSGIIDALSDTPYHLCLDMVTDEEAQEGIYDEMLRTRRVDGLILVEPRAEDERIGLLERDRFPFVIIGNPNNPRIASIDNDNVHAGAVATKHLLSRGYQDVGFLGGPANVAVSDDRIQGYCDTIIEGGGTPRVWHSDFGLEAAREAADRIFRNERRPDAFVVLDDFMANGVLLAARSHHLAVPDDLGIIGFNDSILCRLVDGGLSSVSLNIDLMVRRAVTKLLEMIELGEPQEPIREIVPSALSVRGSSSASRGVVLQ
jgi:DNA-binding LacI/PurR family transcriptional regulator